MNDKNISLKIPTLQKFGEFTQIRLFELQSQKYITIAKKCNLSLQADGLQ